VFVCDSLTRHRSPAGADNKVTEAPFAGIRPDFNPLTLKLGYEFFPVEPVLLWRVL